MSRKQALGAPLWAAVAAATAAIVFLLPWWNRYLGLSLDGYMPWFGHRILGGEVPYRDFFLHLPPLHPLAEAALEAVAGKSIVAGRLAGALGHIVMAAAAAFWLARHYRPSVAVFSTLAALALASSDDTEILDLYNPHAALAALVSGLFAALALAGGRHHRLAGWLAGVAAGAAFWTKQTVGLGATVAVPVALALLALRDAESRAQLARLAVRFAGGWSIVAALIGGWLARHAAFGDFVEQVFADAAGSKGSPISLLTRPWLVPFELANFVRPAAVALALALAAVACVRLRSRSLHLDSRPWLSGLLGGAAAVLLILFAERLADLLPRDGGFHSSLQRLRAGRHAGVLFSLYGVTLLGALAAWTAVRRRLTAKEAELTLFALTAGAITLTQSLSFAGTGAAAFPALALIASHTLDGIAARRGMRWLAVPVLALVAITLVSSVELHRRLPFDFAGWSEPQSSESTERSREPALTGLRLSPVTVETIEGVLAAVRAATDPGEPILSFPVYPIFHWLAERPTATFASLHWIDVTPDRVVDRDLAALLASPPVAVVRQWIPDPVLEINEEYFRGGRESALRRMQAELDRLLDANYTRTFRSPRRRQRTQQRLEVWVRRDRAVDRALVESD